jgi:hypothetical protein
VAGGFKGQLTPGDFFGTQQEIRRLYYLAILPSTAALRSPFLFSNSHIPYTGKNTPGVLGKTRMGRVDAMHGNTYSQNYIASVLCIATEDWRIKEAGAGHVSFGGTFSLTTLYFQILGMLISQTTLIRKMCVPKDKNLQNLKPPRNMKKYPFVSSGFCGNCSPSGGLSGLWAPIGAPAVAPTNALMAGFSGSNASTVSLKSCRTWSQLATDGCLSAEAACWSNLLTIASFGSSVPGTEVVVLCPNCTPTTPS